MLEKTASLAIARAAISFLSAAFCCGLAIADSSWTRIVPSAEVELRDPRSLSVSPEGLIYIADTGHHRVIAVDTAGRLIAETGGFGTTHGQFQWPRVVAAGYGNAVWVMDYGNRRIEKFSRSLEYQGTLEVRVSGDETRRQPEAMAVSPQGDIFVYDRDGSRIVRYDPLFRAQAELGSGSGSQFVSNVSSMMFVAGRGLFWGGRGSREIGRSDPLLNPLPPIRLEGITDHLVMAEADSCLLFGEAVGLQRWCGASGRDILISAQTLSREDIRQLTAAAGAQDGDIYILDGPQGAVFRLRVNSH